MTPWMFTCRAGLPDDQTLYYQEFQNGGQADVFAYHRKSGQREVIISGDLGDLPFALRLSPDGQRMAFARLQRETNQPDSSVSILNLQDGTVSTLLTSQVFIHGNLIWSADGQTLWRRR